MLGRKRVEVTENEVKALQEYLRRQHEAQAEKPKTRQLQKYCQKNGITFKELKV